MVHCSSGVDNTAKVTEALPGREHEPLARLVAYVSMLPRAHLGASPAARSKVEAARRAAVLRGAGSGHDPRKIRARGNASEASSYEPPDAGDPCWALV